METYCVCCKNILRTNIVVSEELSKIDQNFYQIVLLSTKW